MEIYDVFDKKWISFSGCAAKFLKKYDLYSKNNLSSFRHFLNGKTKYSLSRFVSEKHIKCVFKIYCICDGSIFECVSSNSFLKQINEDVSKKKIHEINRLRSKSNYRMIVNFSGKLYCLENKKDLLSSYSLNNKSYADSIGYDDRKKKQYLQRRLSNSLRSRIRNTILNKNESSSNLTGCSIDFLIGWLEAKFVDDMSWDNYGSIDHDTTRGWHIDHIKPCSSFDLSSEEEQRKCFHYTNLQPLWGMDNMIKGAKY